MSKLLLPPQKKHQTIKYLHKLLIVIFMNIIFIHFILLNYKDDNYSNKRTEQPDRKSDTHTTHY